MRLHARAGSMITFPDIEADMRAACTSVTLPAIRSSNPIRITPGEPEGGATEGPIEEWMEIAFHGLTHASQTGEPYALVPCLMDGVPSALVAATRTEHGSTYVLPLFVPAPRGSKFTPLPVRRGRAA